MWRAKQIYTACYQRGCSSLAEVERLASFSRFNLEHNFSCFMTAVWVSKIRGDILIIIDVGEPLQGKQNPSHPKIQNQSGKAMPLATPQHRVALRLGKLPRVFSSQFLTCRIPQCRSLEEVLDRPPHRCLDQPASIPLLLLGCQVQFTLPTAWTAVCSLWLPSPHHYMVEFDR